MPKHRWTTATSKVGVNFVRNVVEGANCIFHKIEQENDLGIDGIVELIRDEEPLNRQLAVQIKSGQSYFDTRSQECIIPVDDHRSYWAQYPLPVYGIVFVPDLNAAFWVDIKHYLKANPGCTTIRFPKTSANLFDAGNFGSVFVPAVLREIPDIGYPEALELFHSSNEDEFRLGLVVLFRRFPNRTEVWDEFITYFIEHDARDIPRILVYFFAHVPWHSDIWAFGEQLTQDTRVYVKHKFSTFGKAEVVKLLSLVDEENMIARGSIGQSVEAVVSSLPGALSLLAEIIDDKLLTRLIRELAGVILAIHRPTESVKYLQDLASEGSWYMSEVVNHIRKWGDFDPYA